VEPGSLLFLSQLLGQPVRAPGGPDLGQLRDLVTLQGDESGLVRGYLVRGREGGSFWVAQGELL